MSCVDETSWLEEKHDEDAGIKKKFEHPEVEKFDVKAAKANLNLFCHKLKVETRESENGPSLRLDSPGTRRFDDLYELGKSRVTFDRELSKLEGTYNNSEGRKSPTESEAETFNRLYFKSLQMQQKGKERREEIERSQQEFDKLSLKQDSKEKISSEESEIFDRLYAGGRNRTPGRRCLSVPKTPTITKASRSSPAPAVVIDRLYGRSTVSQQIGKERREEIDKIRSLSNVKLPIIVSRDSPPELPMSHNSSLLQPPRSSLSPDEIMDRLYGRSLPSQHSGKERREEVEKAIAVSNERLPMMFNREPVPSLSTTTRRRALSLSPAIGRDASTPEETMYRLYGRSLKARESGRDRRKAIETKVVLANSRLPIKVSSSPNPVRSFNNTKMFEKNPRPDMKVRELSPAPQSRPSITIE